MCLRLPTLSVHLMSQRTTVSCYKVFFLTDFRVQGLGCVLVQFFGVLAFVLVGLIGVCFAEIWSACDCRCLRY